MSLAFAYHSLRHSLGNLSLLEHRHCAGHLASMHQSGTHWLKFMLAHALARRFGVPEPQYNHANDLIGGPKDPVRYPTLPRLLSSHTIPHASLRWAATHRVFRLPPYVVLVRDIRASLVSNYEKWRARYVCSFADFLAGDPAGRRFNSDVWWCIRFLNGWHAVREAAPARVLVLRYEDLRQDPVAGLERLAAHLGIPLSTADCEAGAAAGTKEAMAAREDPTRPAGAVNLGEKRFADYFSAVDRERFSALLARHLADSYGYDYSRWDRLS